MQFVMTPGVKRLGTPDWNLIITISTRLYQDKEHFLSFGAKAGKTVVTDGNEDHLCTVDKLIFPPDVKVWAIYGDDGNSKYYTFLLPEEY